MATPPPARGTGTVAAEAIRLQRARESSAASTRRLQLAAEANLRQLETEEHSRQAEHRRALELERAKARRDTSSAALRSGGGNYRTFTPPQSFIAGGAASRISGAPGALDVTLALASGFASSAWVVTRDHQSFGDVGWSIFLGLLGVGLMVEGHGELHDVGVGMAGAQAGYLAVRALGGTQQPGA